jgi:hypothetical protein
MFKYVVRYLKDELARVKRQKMNSQSSAGHNSSVSNSFSPFALDFLAQPGGAERKSFAERDDSRDSFLQRSFAAAASTLGFGNKTEQPGDSMRSSMGGERSSVSTSNRGSMSKPDGGASMDLVSTGQLGAAAAASAAAADASSDAPSMPGLPEGRSPLISAAQGQNLSMLSESPAAPMFMLGEQGTSGAGGPVRPSTGGGGGSQSNSWRDRYVMKFSGYSPNNPDTGLPPNAGAAPQSASKSPMHAGAGTYPSTAAAPPAATAAPAASQQPPAPPAPAASTLRVSASSSASFSAAPDAAASKAGTATDDQSGVFALDMEDKL